MSEESIRSDIEEICSFADRLPGTDAERRASGRLARRLESTGRRVRIEPSYVQPQWPIVHFMHCFIAAIGSMIAGVEPAIGFALVLFAATSAYLDLTARHYLLRRLPFRRASQNVHTLPPGRVDGSPRPTVVLCANVDAPRTGAAYNRLPTALANAATRVLPVASSPTRLWFWSIALLLPPLGARMAGLEASWLAAVQLPQTLILIGACFLLGEIALSPASPGANANASGVAAVLESLRRLAADPPAHLAVEVALCGAGETTMQGMRAFVREHREELNRDATWFVSLESVGRGPARYLTSQGPAVSLPMDPELVGLCEALADGGGDPDPDGAAPRAAPLRDGRTSAAFVARAHKLKAILITCREPGIATPAHHHKPSDTPENVDPEAIEAASAFVVDVIRLLDRDVGRRSGAATSPAPSPATAAHT